MTALAILLKAALIGLGSSTALLLVCAHHDGGPVLSRRSLTAAGVLVLIIAGVAAAVDLAGRWFA